MNITTKEYLDLVEKRSPKSNTVKNAAMSFVVGGSICAAGEIGAQIFVGNGIEKSDAYGYVSMIYVLLAAILTGLNIFDKIAKFGGAGTLVPITGFSNSVVAPALEYKNEGMITGIGVKMFSIAGPVLVYGITASIVYGVIVFLMNGY